MPDSPADQTTALTLASDRERDLLVERLSAACADGRRDLADFSDRIEAALSAKTMAEIRALEVDLGQVAPAPILASGSSRPAWYVGVMSQARQRGRWVLRPRCRALAVMGECVLDLRGAEVAAGQSHIVAVAVMGSVRVIVPEGIDVSLDGLAVMGAKSLRVGDEPPLPGSPSIRVRAVAVMGEVQVVAKPDKAKQPGPARVTGKGERHLSKAEDRAYRRQQRALRHGRHWGEDRQD